MAVGVVAAVATDRILTASRSGGTCVPSGACSPSPTDTTPADATAVLASLPVPQGFGRAECQGPTIAYTVCFYRRRSVLLNPAEMDAWMATFGVTREAFPPRCSPPRRFAVAQFILTACHALGKLNTDWLVVGASSLVWANAKSEVGTTHTIPRVPYHGSQIMVTAQGS